MFLVMGITGKVGGATAERLLARGKEVRALVRNREKASSWTNQGVELVDGDWNDSAAIERALKGVEGAFVMLPAVWAPRPITPTVGDLFQHRKQLWLRLHEKGGKRLYRARPARRCATSRCAASKRLHEHPKDNNARFRRIPLWRYSAGQDGRCALHAPALDAFEVSGRRYVGGINDAAWRLVRNTDPLRTPARPAVHQRAVSTARSATGTGC
jgi:hypothetical protein